MPLEQDGELIITAHASKTSKINLLFFEAHTSVLIPILAIPFSLVLLQVSVSAWLWAQLGLLMAIVVLIILERRGITLATGMKRIRSRLMSRNRHETSKGRFRRRIKLNSFNR